MSAEGRKEGERKDGWTDIQFRQTYRGTDIQTDLERQTDRHTDGQT
jgi:hypothetical protein